MCCKETILCCFCKKKANYVPHIPPLLLLLFFPNQTSINTKITPLCTTFWNGPKWNGTISYLCEQGLGHGHMTILINTEINTEEEAQQSVLNLIN